MIGRYGGDAIVSLKFDVALCGITVSGSVRGLQGLGLKSSAGALV